MADLDLAKLKELRAKATQGEWACLRVKGYASASVVPNEPYALWASGAGPRAVAVDRSACIHADDMDYIAALHNAAEELIRRAERLDALAKALAEAARSDSAATLQFLAAIVDRVDQIEKERTK